VALLEQVWAGEKQISSLSDANRNGSAAAAAAVDDDDGIAVELDRESHRVWWIPELGERSPGRGSRG
jgi:hypothetical protein